MANVGFHMTSLKLSILPIVASGWAPAWSFKRPKFSSRFIEDWAILHPSPETREISLAGNDMKNRTTTERSWALLYPALHRFQNGGFLAIRKPFLSLFALIFDFVVCNGIPARIKFPKRMEGSELRQIRVVNNDISFGKTQQDEETVHKTN